MQSKVIEVLSTELVMFPGVDCKAGGVDLWGDLPFREDQVIASFLLPACRLRPSVLEFATSEAFSGSTFPLPQFLFLLSPK